MYTITTAPDQVKEYTRLNDATKLADKLSEDDGSEYQVIHAETGSVAYVSTPVKGRLFNPWERVETPKHAAPAFEGFVPAYTRRRIGATVYRGNAKGAWRVFDGRTGKFQDVGNTTESRHLLTAMRKGLML